MTVAQAVVYAGLLGLVLAALGLGGIVIGRAYLLLQADTGGPS